MPLERLHLNNFRLFKDNLFEFGEGANLILGKNGTGKTSVLEAINILFSGNSFRTKESKTCINSDSSFFLVSGMGTVSGKNLTLSVENKFDQRIKSHRKLEGRVVRKEELSYMQVILAKHLRMIEGEPEIRRDHFNELMFHVKPSSKALHSKYSKALKQRNKALKRGLPQKEISLWSSELSSIGLDLSMEQYSFFKEYKEEVKNYLEDVTSRGSFKFLEDTSISFTKGWERSLKLSDSLKSSLDKDRALGYTSKGPHRMDFTFSIKKKKAAAQLSRGQLKILILLIFLINIKLIKKITQRETLLMIDDLGSELDAKNLRSLIEQIILSENQIVLTGIEGEEMHQSIKKLTNFTQINL